MNAPKTHLAVALLVALPACSTLAGVEELSTGNAGGAAGGVGGSASPNGGAAGRAKGGASGASGVGAAAGGGGTSAGVGGAAGQAGASGSGGGGGSMSAGAAAGTTSGGVGGAAGTSSGGVGGAAGTSSGGVGGAAGTSSGGVGGVAGTSSGGVAGTSSGGVAGVAGTSAGGSASGAGGAASGAGGTASGAGGSAGSGAVCGNGVVEAGEECDAPLVGSGLACDPATCRLVCSGQWAYRDAPTGACFFVAGNGANEVASWPEAKTKCAQLKARLATFEVSAVRSRVASGLAASATLWVGARQKAQGGPISQPDDGWVWEGPPGSPPIAEGSWGPTEPDDGNGTENGFQDCALVTEDSEFRLYDRSCTDLARALCVVSPP